MRTAFIFLAGFLTLASTGRADVPAGTPPVPTTRPEPWQRAVDPLPWQFPRDHGEHPNFKTEWWYFTGNVMDAQKRRFGYQLTLFRQGVQFKPAQVNSKWAVRDFYFGHFTISDIRANQFHVEERVSRGTLGDAGAAVGRMDVSLGSWSIRQKDGTEQYTLSAHSADLDLNLTEHPLKPLVLEGVHGLSQKDKGQGEASYYYSYPRLGTNGSLRVGDTTYQVSGESWFDHEFSTGSLGAEQVGWDWFCVQLDNHEELMLYVMRDKSGAMDPNSEGTWVHADGTSQRLPPGSFTSEKTGTWRSSTTSAIYPAGWHIVIPSRKAELSISPAMADQELRLNKMGTLNYWEGACDATGTVGGAKVTGVGYTELTGYAGALRTGLEK